MLIFEVLVAVKILMLASRAVALYGPVRTYQRFGETYCLHLYGWCLSCWRQFIWNVGIYLQVHVALQPKRPALTRVNIKHLVRFQVLTVASIKMRAFWDIAQYSLVEVDWCFRGVYCLHHQGDEWVFWWWREYVPDQYRSTSRRLHSVMVQKALIFNEHFCQYTLYTPLLNMERLYWQYELW
jgi:hypothetical protein